MKRVLEEQESTSGTSKRTNPTRKGQAAFVKRLKNRDSSCPVSKTAPDGCEAAHIVPFEFWVKFRVQKCLINS